MNVTDCPWSIVTDVGAMVTASVESTVTDVEVAGVAAPPVGPPTVPVSVSVTVSTQFVVVPVGPNVNPATPEFTNPGQLPDLIDQTKL